MSHHNFAYLYVDFVANHLRQSKQIILVVKNHLQIITAVFFLNVLEFRKDFNFSHNWFFLRSNVLFKNDPDVEIFFATEENNCLRRFSRATLNDYLFFKQLNLMLQLEFLFFNKSMSSSFILILFIFITLFVNLTLVFRFHTSVIILHSI